MAGLFHDVERTAALSEDDDSSTTPRPAAYGTIQPIGSSSRVDSPIDLSPFEELPRPGYSHPQQHRIIPPSITGHGRLIVARRVVPYWVGVLIVIGAFAWAVLCAMYTYSVLSGHAIGPKAGVGYGSA